MSRICFVSGIDTDIGKSYATGMLARAWSRRGLRVITQKPVQTGDAGISADIRLHRRLMGVGLLPEDETGITCTELFSFPASPHLAAELDGKTLDCARIDDATRRLAATYDRVLIEGAGGLMVPLTRALLTVDFVAERGYPLVLVTSGRLGSLNHTLLSLEAAERRGIRVAGVIYNYCAAAEKRIALDTFDWIAGYLAQRHPRAWLATLGKVDAEHPEATELEHAEDC